MNQIELHGCIWRSTMQNQQDIAHYSCHWKAETFPGLINDSETNISVTKMKNQFSVFFINCHILSKALFLLPSIFYQSNE